MSLQNLWCKVINKFLGWSTTRFFRFQVFSLISLCSHITVEYQDTLTRLSSLQSTHWLTPSRQYLVHACMMVHMVSMRSLFFFGWLLLSLFCNFTPLVASAQRDDAGNYHRQDLRGGDDSLVDACVWTLLDQCGPPAYSIQLSYGASFPPKVK
jgi:hypothetical protein